MSSSWSEAVISIIPKEGKSKLECSSQTYLGTECWLQTLYNHLYNQKTDQDQTGFISQRQTHDNIRRSLHILHHIQQNEAWTLEACLISLDAEKAFELAFSIQSFRKIWHGQHFY